MSVFRKLLPHVNIILGLMFVTFCILDKFNRAMNFIANDLSKGLLLAFAVVSVVNACLAIRDNRAAFRRQQDEPQENRQTGNTKED